MQPTRCYFIATTPRTGSFLLAEALEATGIAGKPKEYFEASFDRIWAERLGIASESEFFAKVLEAGTTPNGVFGAKVHWFQLEFLLAKLGRLLGRGEPDPHLLDRTFPDLRYIFLTRRDRVRQAISYVRAIQTEQWWSIPGDPDSPDVPKAEPQFDFDDIERRVRLFQKLEANWRQHFEHRGAEPITVVYEDLAGALEPAVLDVLRHLEVPIPEELKIPPPRLARQADELTEIWVRKYLEMKD